jgi:hypothetical protein
MPDGAASSSDAKRPPVPAEQHRSSEQKHGERDIAQRIVKDSTSLVQVLERLLALPGLSMTAANRALDMIEKSDGTLREPFDGETDFFLSFRTQLRARALVSQASSLPMLHHLIKICKISHAEFLKAWPQLLATGKFTEEQLRAVLAQHYHGDHGSLPASYS